MPFENLFLSQNRGLLLIFQNEDMDFEILKKNWEDWVNVGTER